MLSPLLLAVASSVFVEAAIPGYTQINGQTRLLGSSFGVPGTNATFDYVVSYLLLAQYVNQESSRVMIGRLLVAAQPGSRLPHD